MTRRMRLFIYAAAFAAPPMAAAALGFRALRTRERPAPLPRIDAAAVARAPRPGIDPAKPTVVVVLGSDITEITDALGPYEMFARAGKFNVVTAAAERRPTLLTGGLKILPHYSLAEIDSLLGRAADIVIIPNLPNAAAPRNRSTIDWLRRQADGGALMHSWCKGAMALAETGLLDGEVATAHWGDLPTLEKRYPKVRWVRGVRWVEHGRFVISAGITSGIDASLRVLIRVAGDSVARRVAREIRYPNYRFALDPAAPQYALRAADLVVLANAAYRVDRPTIGVALYDGVGELDLSNVYDTHAYTMAARVETVGEHDGIVRTAHGLTLIPSLTAGDAAVASLRRLMVPGPGARAMASALVTAATAAAPTLPIAYMHADEPARFGLEPVLEDLARTSDAPTARFAERRMEYRSAGVRLGGANVAWRALGFAIAMGALGVLAIIAARAAASRIVAFAAVALLAIVPAAGRAQALDSVPAGTRIRIDLHRSDVSRVRRIFAQPIAGALAGQRGDTMFLAVREGMAPLAIPRTAVREAYVTRGRPGRMESAARRAVIPALTGAAVRGLAASISREPGRDPGRAALTGAATSALAAGIIGAIFPAERWRKVALAPAPVTVADRRRGR